MSGAQGERCGARLQLLWNGGVLDVADGPLGVAGAGAAADPGAGPAELAVARTGPDQGRLVQRAVAVGVLLDDGHQGAVLEAHRAPGPVEALGGVLLGEPPVRWPGSGPDGHERKAESRRR
ncbi:hypothetical protein SZN_03117 [Streptomyces zinciresistens K42]|uniref:Uncharacterized protein n=1 Tax=Streptomyces zinciresistens K42 TaxID=700597 RepID=G2G570_9ACTN|nr:hypothetical protein SZN_03117 [Streptomyces zinciresistens K42]